MARRRLRHDQRRGHRLGPREHGSCALHDAGSRLLLRRSRAPRVGAHHHHAVHREHGPHRHHLVLPRVLSGVRRVCRGHHRQPRVVPALPLARPVHACGLPDAELRHHPRPPLRGLPDDVRLHHAGAHHRRVRRPRDVPRVPPLHLALDHPGLLPLRALDLELQRLPQPVGRVGLRGRDRGAHLGGVRGARVHLRRRLPQVRL
mmetsp:Transcript_46726/g.111242  ORF Transcript_46726/g.111242 Transcript_46726/m.111242 type:complete len:203 (-) Transcript_46726:1186-1794(-)